MQFNAVAGAIAPPAPVAAGSPGQETLAAGPQPSAAPQPVASQAPDFASEAAQSAGLVDSIVAMGQSLLRPALKRAQLQEFQQAQQRVTRVEEARQIVEDQPWYTHIFGPSASAAGAEAMAAMQASQKLRFDVEEQMPTLRQLPPDKFDEAVRKLSAGYMSGNADLDTYIQTGMADAVRSVTALHTNEHLKYIQEQSQQLRLNHSLGLLRSYQTSVQNANNVPARGADGAPIAGTGGTTPPDQLHTDGETFAADLFQSPGESEVSYKHRITQIAQAAGQSYSWDALRQMLHSTALDPDQLKQVITIKDHYVKQFREDAIAGKIPGLEDLGQLTQDIKVYATKTGNVDLVRKATDEFNAKWTKAGADITDSPFNFDEITALLSGTVDTNIRQKERAMDQAAADRRANQERLDQITSVKQALDNSWGVYLTGVPTPVRDKVSLDAFQPALDPKAPAPAVVKSIKLMADIMSSSGGYVNTYVGNQMGQLISATKGKDAVDSAYFMAGSAFARFADVLGPDKAQEVWVAGSQDKDGVARLRSYYDALQATKSDKFPQGDFNAAFAYAQRQSMPSASKAELKDVNTILRILSDTSPSPIQDVGNIDPYNKTILTNLVYKESGQKSDPLALRLGAQVAMRKVDMFPLPSWVPFKHRNLVIYGTQDLQRTHGRLVDILPGSDPQTAARFFSDYVTNTGNGRGQVLPDNGEQVTVNRIDPGKPTAGYLVQWIDKETLGASFMHISDKDVKAAWEAKKDEYRKNVINLRDYNRIQTGPAGVHSAKDIQSRTNQLFDYYDQK